MRYAIKKFALSIDDETRVHADEELDYEQCLEYMIIY